MQSKDTISSRYLFYLFLLVLCIIPILFVPYPHRCQYLGVVNEKKKIVLQISKQDMSLLSLKTVRMQEEIYFFRFVDVTYLPQARKYQVEIELNRDVSFLSMNATVLLRFDCGKTTLWNEIQKKWKGWFD